MGSVAVRGHHADYRHAHPVRAALIVEVAESSLLFDRAQKGSLYARAGIADYWIVNLVDHVVEVYRDPGPDLTAPFGWRYSGGALSSAGYPDATRAAPGNRSRRRAPAIADRPVSFPRLRRG
jgi:hypothetical protein